MPDGLIIQFQPFPVEGIADAWRSLEQRAQVSVFQTWAWIGQWLEATCSHRRLIITVSRGAEIIGLGILTRKSTTRVFGPNRSILVLHANGEQKEDRLEVEYNGLICSEDQIETVHYSLGTVLREYSRIDQSDAKWLEVIFPGCGPDVMAGLTRAQMPCRLTRDHSAPYVDLMAFENGLEPYLASRSANTRQQIRRSIRLFERDQKSLEVRRADTVSEALKYFNEMIVLHQSTWRRRGESGAFSEQFFTEFHKTFVQKHFDAGLVDILHIKVGARLIGVLYNFVHNDTVYAYQSGLISETDNRIKPGLVCHAKAIEHYRRLGLRKYCFLAGDDRYKNSLSTGSDRLFWVTMQQPDLQMRIANLLRKLKNAFRLRTYS